MLYFIGIGFILGGNILSRSTFVKATAAAAVFAATAAIVTPAQAAEELKFTDVKESSHTDAIYALAEAGIISGYGDGTYGPNNEVTRGQVAKIIAGALKLDTTTVEDPAFSDVPKGHQYYGAIAALKQANYISGYGDGTYGVNDPLTRGQMAKIIAGAFGLTANGEAKQFADVPAGHQYKAAVDSLTANGVVQGFEDGTYGPAKHVTRAQVATFVHKAANVETSTANFTLSVMHQNDIHGHLDNLPKTVTAVEQIRAEKEHALLLNAGDAFTGTLYFSEFEGQADLALLNLLNIDAFTLGNHEFDLGSSPDGHQALVDFIKGANFPVLTANVDFSKDDKFAGLHTDGVTENAEAGHIYSAIVKEVDGEKVGIFGLTTAETADISSPGSIAFEDYIEESQKAVDALTAQGINKIVALTHIGYDDNVKYDNDLHLAAAVDGIDLIVGGHSHTTIVAGEYEGLENAAVITENLAGETKEATIIVQAYQYNDILGTVDVAFDENGHVIIEESVSDSVKIADFEANAQAAAILAPFKEQVASVSETPINVTAVEALTNPRSSDEGNTTGVSVRNAETALGNYITEGMLEKAKQYAPTAIMAIQNGGGIRASIDAGDITVGEVISVLPFGNTLATMDVTGAELTAAFEHSFSQYPKESGGFLHVAGATITVDPLKEAGSRIVSIEYKNEAGELVALQADETYTIATNAFTAKGGDGYIMFGKAYAEGRVTDLGLSDWENFRDYLQAQKELSNTPKGNIVLVETTEEAPTGNLE